MVIMNILIRLSRVACCNAIARVLTKYRSILYHEIELFVTHNVITDQQHIAAVVTVRKRIKCELRAQIVSGLRIGLCRRLLSVQGLWLISTLP